MLSGNVIVLDVGKTLAKLSLWDAHGKLLAQRSHINQSVATPAYRALDTAGIEHWLAAGLEDFARKAPVGAIIPVAHGAAAAVVRNGRLACPVQDYEDAVPADLMASYRTGRDAFTLTGSPALPGGLNLGAQLHRLEALEPALLHGDAQILPWPQYWAWKLSGIAASEVTSLGCHSDLWRPAGKVHSELAHCRGWAARLAPLRRADEILGPLTDEWTARTGLARDVRIYCGLHDSNAALLAARGFKEIGEHEATVVSTGTWFVAMRSAGAGISPDLAALSEDRDCLVNVDVRGCPIPSARFMGGREIEILGSLGGEHEQASILAMIPDVLRAGAMLLPGWVPGVGPFPGMRGHWIAEPADAGHRRAALGLYLALMVDVTLQLIGARERILIEGRFAQAEVFVRALATLRPDAEVYVGGAYEGVPSGALRLVNPEASPPGSLRPVVPLDADLLPYKNAWLRRIEEQERYL